MQTNLREAENKGCLKNMQKGRPPSPAPSSRVRTTKKEAFIIWPILSRGDGLLRHPVFQATVKHDLIYRAENTVSPPHKLKITGVRD